MVIFLLVTSYYKIIHVFWFLDRAFSFEGLSILQQSHRDVNTYTQKHSNRLPQWLVTLKDFELPDDGFD